MVTPIPSYDLNTDLLFTISTIQGKFFDEEAILGELSEKLREVSNNGRPIDMTGFTSDNTDKKYENILYVQEVVTHSI